MKGDNSLNGYDEIVEGVMIKTLHKDDNMLMSQFVLEKGSCLPKHSHPNVQSGYLLKGKIRLHINDQVLDLVPGSSWCIQSNLTHWAEILEDSVAMEVFKPFRKEYPGIEYDVEVPGKNNG